VARDRQRAKQRQRRSGGRGGTPTPSPTEHAFPDIEEARLAEAGATPPDVGEELPAAGEELSDAGEEPPDFDRAPDDLERDLAPESATRREAERERHGRPQRGRLITFLGHVIDELRRVQWPDRRQVGQGTLVVLMFVLIAGGYLGLLDAIWQPLVNAIL
jgi:preprotein translocase subunit SecE